MIWTKSRGPTKEPVRYTGHLESFVLTLTLTYSDAGGPGWARISKLERVRGIKKLEIEESA